MAKRYTNQFFFSFLLFFIIVFPALPRAGEDWQKQRFVNIYEPSGVAQLSTGEILIIEDEPGAPVWVVEPSLMQKGMLLKEKRKFILQSTYDDFEGIAVGKNDTLFFLTSHSVTKDGVRKKKREQIVQTYISNGVKMEKSTNELLPALATKLYNQFGLAPQDQYINIEGVAFDDKKEKLIIGLRSPMIDDHSIIFELVNPYGAVAEKDTPVLGDIMASLAIRGGIRAICYDPIGKRYILANEVTDGEKKFSALWFWNGGKTKPQRMDLPKIAKLKNIEGISIIHWKNKNYLLLVCDDGKKKKDKGAHYQIVEYQKLP